MCPGEGENSIIDNINNVSDKFTNEVVAETSREPILVMGEENNYNEAIRLD